ncbi:MAG: hypothetical protein AAFW67_13980, partial [Cyanobacteria bacterium J06638_38]
IMLIVNTSSNFRTLVAKAAIADANPELDQFRQGRIVDIRGFLYSPNIDAIEGIPKRYLYAPIDLLHCDSDSLKVEHSIKSIDYADTLDFAINQIKNEVHQ